MHVGFFGGTFDPPHRGHLAVAQAAAQGFALDKVLLAPTGLQPLKASQPLAGFHDRLAMVELLCRSASRSKARLEATAVDAPLPGAAPNFTIDALSRLRALLTPGDALFVLAGADSFLDLRRWRDPAGLLAAAEWIIISRPGFSLRQIDSLGLTPGEYERVHLLESVNEPVSATEIRSRLRAGEDCSGLLLPEIIRYIDQHHLYGT